MRDTECIISSPASSSSGLSPLQSPIRPRFIEDSRPRLSEAREKEKTFCRILNFFSPLRFSIMTTTMTTSTTTARESLRSLSLAFSLSHTLVVDFFGVVVIVIVVVVVGGVGVAQVDFSFSFELRSCLFPECRHSDLSNVSRHKATPHST